MRHSTRLRLHATHALLSLERRGKSFVSPTDPLVHKDVASWPLLSPRRSQNHAQSKDVESMILRENLENF
jgi:hypothetical protein